MTTHPTPQEDLDFLWLKFAGQRGCDAEHAACLRLQLLFSGPLRVALADPAMRRALEVVAEGHPALIEASTKATAGEWEWKQETEDAGFGDASTVDTFNILPGEFVAVLMSESHDEEELERAAGDAFLICAARNLIHRAAQAMEEPQ